MLLVHSSRVRQWNGRNDGDMYLGNRQRQVWYGVAGSPPADSLDRPRIIKAMNVSLWSKLRGAGVSVKLYAPVVCYL